MQRYRVVPVREGVFFVQRSFGPKWLGIWRYFHDREQNVIKRFVSAASAERFIEFMIKREENFRKPYVFPND